MNALCSFGEPWIAYHASDGSISVIDALGRTVVTLDVDGESWVNAERIVECVNAMNGMCNPMSVSIKPRPLSDRM